LLDYKHKITQIPTEASQKFDAEYHTFSTTNTVYTILYKMTSKQTRDTIFVMIVNCVRWQTMTHTHTNNCTMC